MQTLTDYLDSLNIEYWTEGKNVTKGWVNIQCIFPGCDDQSNHLGINLSSGRFSCWKCRSSGTLTELISELENVGISQAIKRAKSIELGESGTLLPPVETTTTGKFAGLPKTATRDFPKKHIRYLIKRKYDPYTLIRKYKLYACHTAGLYRFRIIIPFFLNHKIITFTSRDVTGKQDPPYLHSSISSSDIDPKHTLYNIDSVRDRVVIVEGVTDVWRIGDGAVALMGIKYVKEQIALLIEKEVKSALVIFDSDATKEGEEFAYQLCGVIKTVDLLELKQGDPDTLKPSKIKQIQRFIKKG